MNTDTNSIESFAMNIGAKKLPFEECLEQYPLFLKLYLDDAVEDIEFFKSRRFYVREATI